MERSPKIEIWAIIGSNLAIAALVIALFTWSRTESRSDNRELRNSTEAILNAIREDIKDFHGRLCTIEERSKQQERK
jgi:hypothetical protein